MKKKVLLLSTFSLAVIATVAFFQWNVGSKKSPAVEKFLSYKKAERLDKVTGKVKFDMPDQFYKYHQAIRTPLDADAPQYPRNHKVKELNKLQARAAAGKKALTPGVISFTERGPANVPGRTRALLVLPEDATHNTWLAGSAGGGIWKTTDAGETWTNISPNIPVLAISSFAQCESDPDIIYAGTGEASPNVDALSGQGILKSTDGGDTWEQIAGSADDPDLKTVARIIVNPSDPDHVVVAGTLAIATSTDGGATWNKTYDVRFGALQQIIADPNDFNIQYASENGFGVLKSTDAGETWSDSNSGMSPGGTRGRTEIAISPVNTSRIWGSTEGDRTGSGSDLYVSSDAGASWDLVNVEFSGAPADFLGGQGWYDNTCIAHPYEEDIVYMGGVYLFKTELGTDFEASGFFRLESSDGFISFVNFGQDFAGGTLEVGSEANDAAVELRFGAGKSQFAHRFQVPADGGTNGDGGAGIGDEDYSYQDYIEVPFEVWEVDLDGNDVRQLMVSFRDQERDGAFDLNVRDDENDPDLLKAREYIYIHDIDYSETASSTVTVDGGHVLENKYFFWPLLTTEGTWTPESLPESTVYVGYDEVSAFVSESVPVADVYSNFDGNNSDVHPDQHFQAVIKENESSATFRIILANDGGIYESEISDDPSVTDGTWKFAGMGYNTTQFYGADKAPGEDRYFGGAQDNGTWFSAANEDASATSEYIFAIGGDGYETIWHPLDPDMMIGGSQFNGLQRSTNGGASWSGATNGVGTGQGTAPFLTRLAYSKALPDVIYAVSVQGVHKSTNFGGGWTTTEIAENWAVRTFMDVEVSRANANVVWAGTGMGDGLSINVSTDQGETFTPVSIYNDAVMGGITKLESHPSEPNTAYALFSFSGRPKVLKTEDLGETWVDITGYGSNNVSSNGFPDVAAYGLYVRPDNPDIIWVGTEIGIMESLDGGDSWTFLEEFGPISAWDFKGQDDRIVLATHGRGIWSAEMEVSQASFQAPEFLSLVQTPSDEVTLELSFPVDYDQVDIYGDGSLLTSVTDVSGGSTTEVTITNSPNGVVSFSTVSTIDGAPFQSGSTEFTVLGLAPAASAYSTTFDDGPLMFNNGMAFGTFNGSTALQTDHNYEDGVDVYSYIRTPITVNGDYPIMTYRDIAIVEPDNDFVAVEGTTDGVTWETIAKYDASANTAWSTAFSGGNDGSGDMFVEQSFDLTDVFSAGDLILIRFRLSANESNNGWGWAIEDLLIQEEPASTKRISYNLEVFPNPVESGTLQINAESINGQARIELFDISGKAHIQNTVKQFTGKYSLNVNDINPGVYTVRITTPLGYDYRKVVIR